MNGATCTMGKPEGWRTGVICICPPGWRGKSCTEKELYGTEAKFWSNYVVVPLNFTFTYFGVPYTNVTLSENGYVCLGYNFWCHEYYRPSSFDIMVGVNYYLAPERSDSGKIFYTKLGPESSFFKLAEGYVNLFSSTFKPDIVYMITYDGVRTSFYYLQQQLSFQIFITSNSEKSFVIFKFIMCPTDIDYYAPSGLTLTSGESFSIPNKKQCLSSNVGQKGVWVIDVTSLDKATFGNLIFFN